MNREQYKQDKGYIRTIHADQTAYSKDNHAGFWLFIAAMLGVGAWAASVILGAL